MNVHFSSQTDAWETPQDFFDKLNKIHNFTLDVCATPENAKCAQYLTKEINGLIADWHDHVCWMNPPYGREIGKWIKKAHEASRPNWQHKGAKVVCLLPARTDTAYWHDYIIPHGKVEFLKGRLKFGNAIFNAPFPSAIVIFERDVG